MFIGKSLSTAVPHRLKFPFTTQPHEFGAHRQLQKKKKDTQGECLSMFSPAHTQNPLCQKCSGTHISRQLVEVEYRILNSQLSLLLHLNIPFWTIFASPMFLFWTMLQKMNVEQCERSSLRHATCTYRDWFRFILVMVCASTSHHHGWRCLGFGAGILQIRIFHTVPVFVWCLRIFNYKKYYYYYIVVFKINKRGDTMRWLLIPTKWKNLKKGEEGRPTIAVAAAVAPPPSFSLSCPHWHLPVLVCLLPFFHLVLLFSFHSPTLVHVHLPTFIHICLTSFIFAQLHLPIWFTFAHPLCLQL